MENIFSLANSSFQDESKVKEESAEEHSEVKLDALLIVIGCISIVMSCILSRRAGSPVSKLQLLTRLMFQALLTWTRPGSRDCHRRSSRGSRRVARGFEAPPAVHGLWERPSLAPRDRPSQVL